MKEVIRITMSTSSGYCCVDDAWEDKIVITDHSVHYEFMPVTQVKLRPVSWTAKVTNPKHLGLFHKLSKSILDNMEAPQKPAYCDVGCITFSVVFDDKSRKSKTFGVLPSDLEPSFSIMKKIVRLATKAPSGMF